MELVEGLQSLGLTQHDAKVYAALVKLGPSKAAVVVEASGLYEAHVYKALRRLQERGMVTGSSGRSSVFSAVEPEQALTELVEQEQERIRGHGKTVKALSTAFREQKSNNSEPPFLTVMRTRPSARGQWVLDLARLYRHARQEILQFARENEPSSAVHHRYATILDDAEFEAIKRGVTVRALVQENLLSNPMEAKRWLDGIRAGEQSRVVNQVPMNTEIIDRHITWLRPGDLREPGVSYRFNSKAFSEAYAATFEYYWSQGTDLAEYLKSRPKTKTRRRKN